MGGVYLTSQRSIVFAELGATEYLVLCHNHKMRSQCEVAIILDSSVI